MTIQIYSIGDIKKDLLNASRLFNNDDTLGGINSRHINFLEKKFNRLTEKKSVFVNSCTNGIYLALKKLNVKDKYVIIPPITFFGIAAAVLKAGGIPIYSRVDKYGLMDTESVLELTSKYKVEVIIPSHINNRYVELNQLSDYNIIEDAAPSYGLRTNNNNCLIHQSKNTIIISFSFGKPLTAGEGGMIFTKTDENWYKGQRFCGLDNSDGMYGYNAFNVTNSDLKYSNNSISAALVTNKLKEFNTNLEKNKKIANFYNESFGSLHDCDLYKNGNHQTYVILSKNRNQLMAFLNDHGIKSYCSHRPVFYNEAFKFNGAENYIYTSENYFQKILHIPCRFDLTDTEINFIAETVKKGLLA